MQQAVQEKDFRKTQHQKSRGRNTKEFDITVACIIYRWRLAEQLIMPGVKRMMMAVLLTLMTDRVHDATPNRDAMHQQEDNEDGEEENMDAEEAGDDEGEDVSRSTRAQTARGARRGMEREDVGGKRSTNSRQNANAERDREWYSEQFENRAVKSFRKKELPRIMTERSGEPPSKKVIDTWLNSAKTIMASEDLEWIVNLTNAMRKNADTDEYFIKHPTGRKLLLEEEDIDTSDKGEILKIMQHLVAHKAPAREYQSLRKGEKYTEDLAVQDFKDIKREMVSFNAQMMKVLEDRWSRRIYGRHSGEDSQELRNGPKHFRGHLGLEDD